MVLLLESKFEISQKYLMFIVPAGGSGRIMLESRNEESQHSVSYDRYSSGWWEISCTH